MALPGYVNKVSNFCKIFSKLPWDNLFLVKVLSLGVLMLVFSGVTTDAQTVDGSVYSFYGIGNLQGRTTGYNRALGYTGVAVRDDHNISAVNPAAYNAIAKPFTSIFELGAYYASTKHQSVDASSSSRSGNLSGINLLFRPSSKLGIGMGVSPLANINYKATSARTFVTLSPTSISYEGSGGINQFYFGLAFEVFKNFSVGANASYYIGTIKKIENVAATFAVPDQLVVANLTTAHNLGGDAGAQYSFLIKKTKITLGATWNPGTSLSGTQQTSIVNSNLDTLKQTDKVSANYRMPATYGGGLGIKSGRSTLAADVHWINWKTAIVNDGQTYQDSWKYSVGYEYRGDLTALKYLNAISLRAGAFVQDYPLVLKNTPFKTWGYTVGISLPLDGYRASININYAFTQLGTTKAGLIQENSNRLVLDFIIRDIWGVKRKLD
jgi:hypothetical protein